MADRPKVPWHDFEDEVFKAVKRAIRRDYGLDSKARIEFRRDAEYRGQSGNLIKIEISVEFYRTHTNEPHTIWLWECKHKQARKVEVGDISQLSEKISDIGKSRAKGSMVTSVGFQEGAIKQAEMHGITLCLLHKELVWLSRYADNEADEQVELIYVTDGVGFDGKPALLPEFEPFVRHCLRTM